MNRHVAICVIPWGPISLVIMIVHDTPIQHFDSQIHMFSVDFHKGLVIWWITITTEYSVYIGRECYQCLASLQSVLVLLLYYK